MLSGNGFRGDLEVAGCASLFREFRYAPNLAGCYQIHDVLQIVDMDVETPVFQANLVEVVPRSITESDKALRERPLEACDLRLKCPVQ